MTKFKSIKNKILAGFLAAGLMLGAGAITVFADTEKSTASIQFESGILELIEVSDIGFGEGDILSENKTYGSTADTLIELSDNRGTNTGWTLTAQLGEFTVEGTPTLRGATINVSTASIRKLNNANTSDTPVVNRDVELVAGADTAAANVAVAGANQGAGAWEITWAAGEGNTELTVLGDTARQGIAKATITWTLQDAA